jgi:hypothetical protein
VGTVSNFVEEVEKVVVEKSKGQGMYTGGLGNKSF